MQTDLSADAMKSWVGIKVFWGKILDQMVGGVAKKVLYVDKVEKPGDDVPVEEGYEDPNNMPGPLN